jgi:hypothetical protein
MAGTWAQPPSTIAATVSTSPKQPPNATPTQFRFFSYNCPIPKNSSADAATATATALIHALRHLAPALPFLDLGDDQLAALDQLAAIFQSVAGPSTEPPPRVESHEPPQPTSAHRYPLRSSPAAPIRSGPTSSWLPARLLSNSGSTNPSLSLALHLAFCQQCHFRFIRPRSPSQHSHQFNHWPSPRVSASLTRS